MRFKNQIIGIGGLLILIGIMIHYNNLYCISEGNIQSALEQGVGITEGSIVIKEESNLNGIKAILFEDNQINQGINLVIFIKGINNKYRLQGVYTGNTKYVTRITQQGKLNMIEAGDNRDGKFSYIKFEDGQGDVIQIEQDIYVKIFELEENQVYNYYNDNNKVVEVRW